MAIGYRRSADICQNRGLRDCGGRGRRLWVSVNSPEVRHLRISHKSLPQCIEFAQP